ncbi:MAG: hypothetical protein NVS4B11_06960 [Ktedonobacteraceae bacterium]
MEKTPSTVARSQPARTKIDTDFATKQCIYGVDNNRFTCPCFACKHIEKAVQMEVQRVDNGEVFDV